MISTRKNIETHSGCVGLISDTHGLVRPEALAALEGSELIFHCGDIGKPEVLERLETLAPVVAIRGNNDRGPWASKLPDMIDLRVNGLRICMIHDVNDLSRQRPYRAVISGHSHQPRSMTKDGVLFINPGSAGPRRFKLPVSVARLRIFKSGVRVKILQLDV